MRYITEYEFSAFLFLIMTAVIFVAGRKRSNMQSKTFGLFVSAAVVTVFLDMTTAYTVEYAELVPNTLNNLLLALLFVAQYLMAFMYVMYTLSFANMRRGRLRGFIIALTIPFAIYALLVLSNPLTSLFYGFTDAHEYVRYDLFLFIYVLPFVYEITGIVILVFLRKRMRTSTFLALLFASASVIGASALQFFIKDLLLIGVAISLSMMILYLVVQSPSGLIDEMTGAFNSRCLTEFFEKSLSNGTCSYGIHIIIDNIHLINTIYGRQTGRIIASSVAHYLQSFSRENLYFMSGNQFLLFFDDIESTKASAEKIIEQFKQPWKAGGFDIFVETHLAYGAPASALGATPSEVIIVAQHILDDVQEKRLDALFVTAEAVAAAKSEIEVELAMRDAVQSKTLEVSFQPLFNTQKKKFTVAEALLRYTHPTIGVVEPRRLIAIAEKSGMALDVGRQVLELTCKFIAENKLCDIPDFEYVSVNLSAAEFVSDELLHIVDDTMERYGVRPENINFEISETTATVTNADAAKILRNFKSRGISFTMDDFGAGYANLESVLRLPFSTIKFDQSMISEHSGDSKSAVILEEMIAIVRDLGISAVIEGIETPEYARFADSLGPDYMQGFIYARPVSGKELTGYLKGEGVFA